MGQDKSKETMSGEVASAMSPSDDIKIKPRVLVLILGGLLCLIGVADSATMVRGDLRSGSIEVSTIIESICAISLFAGIGASVIGHELKASAHRNRSTPRPLIILGSVLLLIRVVLFVMTFILMGGLMPGGVPRVSW